MYYVNYTVGQYSYIKSTSTTIELITILINRKLLLLIGIISVIVLKNRVLLVVLLCL